MNERRLAAGFERMRLSSIRTYGELPRHFDGPEGEGGPLH
jgi:hypothetical protein